MKLSYNNLILSPDDAIDLQLHTLHSDGKWTAEALLDHLIAEQFALAAITDHDQVDTVASLQALAVDKQFPLLVAVEMSSMWKGDLTDFLCYGFDPANSALAALARDTSQHQHDNTRQIFAHLLTKGYPLGEEVLQSLLALPAAQQMNQLAALIKQHNTGEQPTGRILVDAGFAFMTAPPAAIVEAAHQSGAICILAHPGRDDGFTCYDVPLLDELRAEAPIDGIEAYYPMHSPQQTAMYEEYAAQHNLLVSSGSDSHSVEKPPVKYRAALSRKLLERLGIEVRERD